MVAFRCNECRTVCQYENEVFFSKIETGICIFEKKTVTLRAFCEQTRNRKIRKL